MRSVSLDHPAAVSNRWIVSFLLLAVLAPWGFGQTAGTGALTGTVRDPSGAVILGARVVISNPATSESRTVFTRADGTYTAPNLPPGLYRVEVSSEGFKRRVQTGVQTTVTETSILDIELELGDLQEEIFVVEDTQLLQSEFTSLGRVVRREVVTQLPLVTRNYTEILALSSGIVAPVSNASQLGRGTGGEAPRAEGEGVYVQGGRSYDNNFQLNGAGINVLFNEGGGPGVAIPNPDTIETFKVQTGLADATFGRNAGGSINVVSKGGSNEWHGSLFHFFRNEALNANDFFFNRAGLDRGILRQNQFGGTAGGPIDTDRVFVFGSYQGIRQRNGIAGSAGGAGAFVKCRDTALGPPLTDDRSREALGALFGGRRGLLQDLFGGVGPALAPDGSNVHPAALALLQFRGENGFLIPTPQFVDPSLPFDIQGVSIFSRPCTFDEDQFMANLDFVTASAGTFSSRLFGAFSDQLVTLPGGNTHPGNLPGFPQRTDNRFWNYTLANTYVFGPAAVNQVQLAFHRVGVRREQETPFRWSDLGVSAPPQIDRLPAVSILGSYGLGGQLEGSRVENHFSLSDTLSLVRGRHFLRLGGSLSRVHLNTQDFNFNGTLVFLSWPDFLLGLSGPANGTFAFSNVFASIGAVGLFDRSWRVWDAALFVQDDFKVHPRLTLNLGLRYEHLGAFSDELGRNGTFDVARANSNPPPQGSLEGFVVASDFPGAVLAGVTQLDNPFAIRGEGRNRLAPRLGFAWQLFSDLRMVLRGGYGIHYSRPKGQLLFQQVSSPPFSSFLVSVGVGNALSSLENPFPPAPQLSDFPVFTPYSPVTALSLNAVAQDFQPSIVQQFGLNLQQQIGRDYLLEVGYVGARGTKLYRSRLVNQALNASPSNPVRGETTNTLENLFLRRPVLGFDRLLQVESAGSSWYNSLQASLTKRFSDRLQFLASYTFAKSLDSDGAGVDLTSQAAGTPGDQNDPRRRWGPSSTNRPHRFVISYVLELPGLPGRPPLLRTLLGGWSLTGVGTFQTGRNLSIRGNNGNNAFGVTDDLVQLSPGCNHGMLETSGPVHNRLGSYFNTNCFVPWPVIGADGMATDFGNSGTGIVRGPDQRNLDLALIKKIRFNERVGLDVRTELFNVFNTPQFADPDTTFTNPTFGTITSTSVNPRILQFALKLRF